MKAITIAHEVETSVSFAPDLMFECPVLTAAEARSGLCRPTIPQRDPPINGRLVAAIFEPEVAFAPEIRRAGEWLVCNAA